MRILVINCGSTTLKYALYETAAGRLDRRASATLLWEGGYTAPEIRRRVCEALGWTGLSLDAGRNARGEERISRDDTRPAAFALQSDEEGAIAAAAQGIFGAAS